MSVPLPQRGLQAIGESSVGEQLARAQERVYAGNVVAAGAGLLGGHLALNRGTARRAGRAGRTLQPL